MAPRIGIEPSPGEPTTSASAEVFFGPWRAIGQLIARVVHQLAKILADPESLVTSKVAVFPDYIIRVRGLRLLMALVTPVVFPKRYAGF